MDPAPGAVAAKPPPSRRIWYVAALIAIGGVLAAAAVLFLIPIGGDLGQRMMPGQPVTVHVPEAGKMVWATGDGRNVTDLRCEPSPRDTRELAEWVTVSTRRDELILDADGERWRAVALVRASPVGRYTVVCTATGADAVPSLSIGDPPRFYDARSKTLTGLTAVVLALLGVLIAIALVAVAAVRRR